MSSGVGPCESYEDFQKLALKTFYEKGGKNARLGFIAMLLASGEAWKVAAGELKDRATPRNLAAGAAGAFVLRLLLKHVIGGPISIVLTGASVASLVALYVRNHKRIMSRIDKYRAIVAEHRAPYEEIQASWRSGSVSELQRDLMTDGLLKRFLDAVDEVERAEQRADAKSSRKKRDDDDDATSDES